MIDTHHRINCLTFKRRVGAEKRIKRERKKNERKERKIMKPLFSCENVCKSSDHCEERERNGHT
jgi:hypothetical protein